MSLADLLDLISVSGLEILSVDELYIAIRTPAEHEAVVHIFRKFGKAQLESVTNIVFSFCAVVCEGSALPTAQGRVVT